EKCTWASINPGITHFPRASTTCAFPGTRTSLRGPMSRIRPPSITIALFRMEELPVPLINVAPWMTMMPPGCCAARMDATNRQSSTKLIFHVFMLAFLDEDLNSLLGHKRKHDKCAEWIAPSQIHSVAHQHRDEKDQGEIRIADGQRRDG